jgi:hypothetical protein
MQQYAAYILFYCIITLHAPGAVHTHQQEYINCSYSHCYKSYDRPTTSIQLDSGHVGVR